MDDVTLLDTWRRRYGQDVSGWDFSDLGDSLQTEEPPWQYRDLVAEALTGRASALDMGTGGGEVLRGLADLLPPDTRATEGWAPNVPVATAALAPLGIPVTAYDPDTDARMPYDDVTFDVVLNRHESYDAGEVARVLRPGGVLLTQQVDGRNVAELYDLFGGTPQYLHVNLENLIAEAEEAGLAVQQSWDWAGRMRVADVATLVGYAAMAPWEFPDDFSVDTYADVLLGLHNAGRPIDLSYRLFALRALKPR